MNNIIGKLDSFSIGSDIQFSGLLINPPNKETSINPAIINKGVVNNPITNLSKDLFSLLFIEAILRIIIFTIILI